MAALPSLIFLDDYVFSRVALLSVFFFNTVVLVPFNSILRSCSSTLPLPTGHARIRDNSLLWIVRLSNLATPSRLKALQRRINLAQSVPPSAPVLQAVSALAMTVTKTQTTTAAATPMAGTATAKAGGAQLQTVPSTAAGIQGFASNHRYRLTDPYPN